MAAIKGTLEGIMQSLNKAKSTDKTRYYMNEVYLDKSDSETVLVATNGCMLVIYKPDTRAINTLKLDSMPEGYVVLDSKRLMVTPIKIDGQFPAWRKVVPESKEYTIMERNGLCAPKKGYKLADILARFALESGILIAYEYAESIAYFDYGKTYINKDKAAYGYKAIQYTTDRPYGQYTAMVMPYKQNDD